MSDQDGMVAWIVPGIVADVSGDRCPDCGELLDHIKVHTFGRAAPQLIPVRRCCEPQPTAAQMARQADDAWLARQRRLAEIDEPR